MRLVLVSAVAVCALGISAADAQHAPTRRKVVETIEITASPDQVWDVLGKTDDSTWVRDVDTSLEQGGDPAQSIRTLTLRNGHTITEKGRAYDAAHHSFSYYITQNDVHDLPAGDYSATVSVEPAADGHAKVEWKAAFYRGYPNNDPPPELNDENSEKGVRAWMRASLENLKKKVEKDRT